MYWLNYLDRNAIALARINSLEEDTKLTGSQYQTCVSILFVGYILGQVPSNMLITRLRPSYYMSACMFLWAVVSGLTAMSTNFTGLFLTRFFLGAYHHTVGALVTLADLKLQVLLRPLTTQERCTFLVSSTLVRSWPPVSPSSTLATSWRLPSPD